MLNIHAPRPAFELNAPNFTEDMTDAGHCRAWFTADRPDITLSHKGELISIDGRIGTERIVPAAFGTAPGWGQVDGNLPGLVHRRDILDHACFDCAWLQTALFSVAVIALADADMNRPQNLISVASGGRNLRIMHDGRVFWVKENGVDVIEKTDAKPNPGPFLAVLSASDGKVRLAIHRPDGAADEMTADKLVDIAQPIRVVLAADQIAEEPDRPTPSPPRSWRGRIFDALAFDTDILADTAGPQRTILLRYLQTVYGASA